MRWSFGIGRIAGIRIELHVTFVLFVVWIATVQGFRAGDAARALMSALLLLLVFTCVLLHELGHALAARRYGIRTRNIILLPIGGLARLERMPENPVQEMVVAIAGPAVNVAILAVLSVIATAMHVSPEGDMSGGLLDALFAVNLMMVAFNLIPAFPMDGGRVLRALLALRLPYVRATRIASGIGQAIAVVFAIVGLFSNPMLVFVALFVFLAAGEEHALVQARSSLSGLPVRAAMVRDFQVLQSGDPLQRAVDLLMDGSQQDFPVLDGDRPVGVLTRSELLRALKSNGPMTRVGDTVIRRDETADPMEPLDEAVRRMREHGLSGLPVVDAGRMVGFVTLENVSELLLVQDALQRHVARA
jgi:Zn-dependent protease/CBS domain-containing protein